MINANVTLRVVPDPGCKTKFTQGSGGKEAHIGSSTVHFKAAELSGNGGS